MDTTISTTTYADAVFVAGALNRARDSGELLASMQAALPLIKVRKTLSRIRRYSAYRSCFEPTSYLPHRREITSRAVFKEKPTSGFWKFFNSYDCT